METAEPSSEIIEQYIEATGKIVEMLKQNVPQTQHMIQIRRFLNDNITTFEANEMTINSFLLVLKELNLKMNDVSKI